MSPRARLRSLWEIRMDGRIDISFPAANPALPLTASAQHLFPFWMRRLRTVVLALAAVLVLRAVFLEPFGVPTGSMAPTIFGVHRDVNCPNCGYPVRVGEPPDDSIRGFFDVACGNCGAKNLGLAEVNPLPGDRLLVDKSAFDWRAPRRWEIVVFRTSDDPSVPYIKRIVGLPGETLRISDGDVIVNGALARKTLAQARAVAIPVYCMSCRPSEGWNNRWQVESAGPPERAPRVDGSDLIFSQSTDGESRSLVYRSLRDEPIGDALPFNGRRMDIPIEWVHDFLLTCDLDVRTGAGQFAISLNDGADEAMLTLSANRGASMEAGGQKRESPAGRLKSGAAHRLEFAFVDRRVSVRLDGAAILEPIDLPAADIRSGVSRPLRLSARDLAVVVRNLRLDRDLHYTAAGRLGTGQCRIGPSEYFLLGDNSGNSEDSRFWTQPGVPTDALLGKPVFIYAPRRWHSWTALGRTWDVQAIDERRFGWIR